MTLLILFFVISILFSFLCSIWEAVLLSIPPSKVQIMAEQESWLGTRLKYFKDNIDRPLSAILTLNTIAHTAGAIGVGVQASKLWGEDSQYQFLGIHFNMEAVIASIMTLCILILSEIIPKTIGASYWNKLISFTVFGVSIISTILFPFVWLSQWITKLLKKGHATSVLSRSDISAMAEIGAQQGELDRGESRIIRNLLRFKAIRAKDIMTPRTVVLTAKVNDKIGAFYNENRNLRFSRIPVFEGDRDNIQGFMLKDELLEAIISGRGDEEVHRLMKPVDIVPDNQSLPEIFEMLIEKRLHLAAVVDEFGGFAGIVTVEDIIETLLGLEILDELDNIEDMQKLARENWIRRAKKLGLYPEKE